jgi:hypothetical protein
MTEPSTALRRPVTPLSHVVTAPSSKGLPPRMRDLREVIRDEHVMRPQILAALADGPLSIPEIAAAIGQPEREVVFWVMGMRRFNHVHELHPAEDDGYFRYRLATSEG